MKRSLLRTTAFAIATFGLAAIPSQAFAHQVQTNYILGNQIGSAADESLELRSTFSNGEPLKGAKVVVYAPDQSFQPYTTGVTDDQGRFSFQPDETITGNWEVNIRRAGHQDILAVPVTEEGIEPDLMSTVVKEDTHYASSPLMAVGSIAMVAACIGFGRISKKSEE
jgi:nickel transport protein